jgi:tripartite-type tricarboxylate transporter receptor subunit TctC
LALSGVKGNAMKLLRRQFLHLAAGAAAVPGLSDMATAQAWPARPVRLIVPFPPGGTTDIFARIAAQKLSEHFGKQFYIETIAGATGNVGAAQVARATPDGYTVLFTFSSYVVNPTLFAKLPFDPNKDLKPVTLAVAATNVLTINPSVPARNLGDLIALIKSNPGKYNYASGGVGTQAHLLGEMLRLSLALDIVHACLSGFHPQPLGLVFGYAHGRPFNAFRSLLGIAGDVTAPTRRLRPATRISREIAGSESWYPLERRTRSSACFIVRWLPSLRCRM